MNSLLELESLVSRWTKKTFGHYQQTSYGAYGMHTNGDVDETCGPKVKVENLKYTANPPIELPGLTFIEWSDNATREPVTNRFLKSTTTSSTSCTSVTNGVSIGFGVQASINVGFVSAGVSINTEISSSSTNAQTTSKEETWNVDKTITVPSMSSVEMIWSIGEQKVNVDFTADITVSGYFYGEGNTKDCGKIVASSKTQCQFGGLFYLLDECGIEYPRCNNIKFVEPKGTVQFTVAGTIAGQNAISSKFQAIEHPLRIQ